MKKFSCLNLILTDWTVVRQDVVVITLLKRLQWRFSVFLVFALDGLNCSLCTSQTRSSDIIKVAAGRTISDPNSVLNTVAFLREESVASAVRLDEDQRNQINAILNETRGQPDIVISAKRGVFNGEREKEKDISNEAKIAMAEGIRRQREIKVNEILDPLQRDRLKQIAYNIEVIRNGLGGAIIDGFLGEDAGVEEYEKPALAVSFDVLQAEYNRARLVIIENSERPILELLTEPQRKLLVSLLGKAFVVQERQVEKLRRSRNQKNKQFGPDPESLLDCLFLIKNTSIAIELGFSQDDVKAIDLFRSHNEGKIDALFSKKQKLRLTQIVNQMELATHGLGPAILEGFLGKAIELEESNRTAIKKLLPDLEQKKQMQLIELDDLARANFLGKLSAVKREKVSNLIGKPFRY